MEKQNELSDRFTARMLASMFVGMMGNNTLYLDEVEMEIYKNLITGANLLNEMVEDDLKTIEQLNANAKRVITETEERANLSNDLKRHADLLQETLNLANETNELQKRRINELENRINEIMSGLSEEETNALYACLKRDEPHETTEDLIFGESENEQ